MLTVNDTSKPSSFGYADYTLIIECEQGIIFLEGTSKKVRQISRLKSRRKTMEQKRNTYLIVRILKE